MIIDVEERFNLGKNVFCVYYIRNEKKANTYICLDKEIISNESPFMKKLKKELPSWIKKNKPELLI